MTPQVVATTCNDGAPPTKKSPLRGCSFASAFIDFNLLFTAVKRCRRNERPPRLHRSWSTFASVATEEMLAEAGRA